MIKIGNLSINGSGVDIYIDESDDFSQKYENIKNIKKNEVLIFTISFLNIRQLVYRRYQIAIINPNAGGLAL